MAYEVLNTKSITCGAATLATDQFCFVNINTLGKLALPSAGGRAVGVLQDKPAAGSPGSVCSPGDITKVVVGTGGITAGDDVMTDASGNCVTWTSTHYKLGVALETQATQGNIADILFQPLGKS